MAPVGLSRIGVGIEIRKRGPSSQGGGTQLNDLTLTRTQVSPDDPAGYVIGEIVGKTPGSSIVITNSAGNTVAQPAGIRIVRGLSAIADGPRTANITIRETAPDGTVKDNVIALSVAKKYKGDTGYKFASNRFRSPSALGTCTANRERSVHRCAWVSPDYPTNNFRMAFASHWTNALGSLPSELAAANPFTIQGVSIQAFISGAWVNVMGAFAGAASVTIDPATNPVGVLTDDITFAQDIPPNTPMRAQAYVIGATGATIPVSSTMKNRSGVTDDVAFGHASADLSGYLSNTGAWTTPSGGGDGRLGGSLFGPSFIIARAPGGLDRPVFWFNGDSIGDGKNALENFAMTASGARSFVDRGFDESTVGRRMSYYNSCIPGVGATEQSDRTKWSRKLDLIRMCPNRPYTHIVTEHNNNGGVLTDFVAGSGSPTLNTYLALLASESAFWGDVGVPIFQTRPIPRPGSWAYDLASQATAPPLTDNKWLFDSDLANDAPWVRQYLRGCIDVARDYSYDQGANRNKIKVPVFTTTLAADAASGANVISTVDAPPMYSKLLLDPTNSPQAPDVIGVSGSGPYTVNLAINLSAAKPANTVVKETYGGDNQSLHPATLAHILMAAAVADWKKATFG